MPRGNKVCPNCGANCGPRSWNCHSCGKGFVTKGTQHPDININARTVTATRSKQEEVDQDTAKRLMAQVTICGDEREVEVRRKFYGENSETWESLCGNYRIRFGPNFQGVEIADGKCYKLLVKHGDSWDLAPGKFRFRRLTSAIKMMLRLKSGKTVSTKPKHQRGRRLVSSSR